MIFVDTGIWYSIFVPADADHQATITWFRGNPRPLVTTDYIVDEVLTLMRSRGEPARALIAGQEFFGALAAVVRMVEPQDVLAAWEVFRRFNDKRWSFTDCVSYAVMERLKIDTAASFDHHFRQFGTVAIIP